MTAPTAKQRLLGFGLLALMGLFGLFFAFVVSPAISQSSGVADEIVSFALGGVFLVIAVGCGLLARMLNKKKATEGK
jgi:nitrate reductase gamma subunit